MSGSRSQPVTYFDRYSGEIREEAIYGEAFLRWAYETAFGRATTNALVKRAFFSRLYGWWVSRPASRKEAIRFIEEFGLDTTEFEASSLSEFCSFNDFFSRRLKPEARPVHPGPESVVFPADGRHLGYQNFAQADSIYAKGQRFELGELLGEVAEAGKYSGGAVVISRLCPVDYHRFHFCAEGVPGPATLINGDLFSVNPIALRRRLRYLVENKRVVTCVDTPEFGTVITVEVGATNVGSIIQTYVPAEKVVKGAEKGYFSFGGSMTITLFEPDRVQLADDLLQHSMEGREIYARMGDFMGKRR